MTRLFASPCKNFWKLRSAELNDIQFDWNSKYQECRVETLRLSQKYLSCGLGGSILRYLPSDTKLSDTQLSDTLNLRVSRTNPIKENPACTLKIHHETKKNKLCFKKDNFSLIWGVKWGLNVQSSGSNFPILSLLYFCKTRPIPDNTSNSGLAGKRINQNINPGKSSLAKFCPPLFKIQEKNHWKTGLAGFTEFFFLKIKV